MSAGSSSKFHTLIGVSERVFLAASPPGCPFQVIHSFQSSSGSRHLFVSVFHSDHRQDFTHCLLFPSGFSSPSARPIAHFKPFIPFSLHPVQAIHSFQFFIRVIVKIPHTDCGFQAGFPLRQHARLPISSHSCLSVAHPVQAIHSFQSFIRIIVKIPHSAWDFQAGFLRRQLTRLFISSHIWACSSICPAGDPF